MVECVGDYSERVRWWSVLETTVRELGGGVCCRLH